MADQRLIDWLDDLYEQICDSYKLKPIDFFVINRDAITRSIYFENPMAPDLRIYASPMFSSYCMGELDRAEKFGTISVSIAFGDDSSDFDVPTRMADWGIRNNVDIYLESMVGVIRAASAMRVLS